MAKPDQREALSTMRPKVRIEVPHDVCELIAKKREDDDVAAQADRRRKRAAAREQARILKLKRPLARRALQWTRDLANAQLLPARGLQVFRGGTGRIRNTVSVSRDGTLALIHVVAPFGGCRVEARSERDLLKVPLDDLQQFVAAIDNGDVWEHVRRALERT